MKILQSLLRFLCIYLCFVGSVGAQNLVTAQAYWEDTSGQASFAEARTQNYASYKGVLNNGFTDAATWLRLRISHLTSNPQDRYIVLRVQPNHLDEVELFDPLAPTARPRLVGDRTAYADQEYKSPSYGFVLPIGHQDRDVWLRVKSANLHVIQVDAYGEIAMQSEEKDYLLTASICLGLVLFIFAFNLFNWVWNREWLYTVFVFRTFYFTLILSIYFGFARMYLAGWLAPDWLDFLLSMSLILTTPLVCYFEFALLREYGLKPWTRWLQYGIHLVMVFDLLLYAFGMKSEALQLNAMIVVVLLLVLLSVSLWGLEHRVSRTPEGGLGIDKKYFTAYYVLLAFTHPLVSSWCLAMIGMTPVILSMFPYYAVLSSLSMTMIVQFRANNIRKNHNQLQLNMALMDERVASERQRREEQSNLLSMLMHEVRNPLAVIEVAQNQENAGNEELVRKNVSKMNSGIGVSFTKLDATTLQVQVVTGLPSSQAASSQPPKVEFTLVETRNAKNEPVQFQAGIGGEQLVIAAPNALARQMVNTDLAGMLASAMDALGGGNAVAFDNLKGVVLDLR